MQVEPWKSGALSAALGVQEGFGLQPPWSYSSSARDFVRLLNLAAGFCAIAPH